MSSAESLSTEASRSAVVKKAREPSAELPRNEAGNSPLPLIWPAETSFVVPAERS
jgi:hypothetical protein